MFEGYNENIYRLCKEAGLEAHYWKWTMNRRELLDKHPDFIWFPCSKWERQEDEGAGNHFNCPIVASYPEALRLNIDELRTSDVVNISVAQEKVRFFYPKDLSWQAKEPAHC